MNTEKTVIQLPDGCTEITIREGVAVAPLALKEPKSIALSGDIHAVSNYVAIRSKEAQGIQVLNPKTAIVEVNKNARTIIFNSDPENHYGVTVTAKLEASEELKQFGINTDSRHNRKSLHKLLKFGRGYFADRVEYDAVIAGLVKLRAKTTAELEQSNNGKGSRSHVDVAETVMNEGFKDVFTLSVPLFKGFSPEKIEVEILYEVKDGDVSFWLESVGLKQTTDEAIDGIFETELKNVKDYVTIFK